MKTFNVYTHVDDVVVEAPDYTHFIADAGEAKRTSASYPGAFHSYPEQPHHDADETHYGIDGPLGAFGSLAGESHAHVVEATSALEALIAEVRRFFELPPAAGIVELAAIDSRDGQLTAHVRMKPQFHTRMNGIRSGITREQREYHQREYQHKEPLSTLRPVQLLYTIRVSQ